MWRSGLLESVVVDEDVTMLKDKATGISDEVFSVPVHRESGVNRTTTCAGQ